MRIFLIGVKSIEWYYKIDSKCAKSCLFGFKGGYVVLKFREEVLEPFADEAQIMLVDYFHRKNMKRSQPVGSYSYDDVDKIIIEVVKGLRNQSRLFDTFAYLYYCYKEKDVQIFLEKPDKNDVIRPLKRATVLTYKRKVLNWIHNEVDSNKELKERIIKTMKAEYEKAKK